MQSTNQRRSARKRFVMLAIGVTLSAPYGRGLLAQSPLPGYGPTNGRYRVDVATKQTQLQMGQSQASVSTSNRLMSIAVAKSGSDLSLSITIDSASATTTAPVPAVDMSSLVGATLAGSMGADGHVATSTVADRSGKPLDPSAALSVRSILPRLKVGATLGTTWLDTTSTKGPQNGAVVSTMTIVTYTLAGDTTIAGARGWKLTSTFTGTIEGAGNQGGADFTIKGTITGQGTVVIGVGGVFVGSNASNEIQMTVDVPMASMQIPIVQQTTTTITRLP